MSKASTNEANLLLDNIENQLKRLLTQLDDIELMKDDLDADEYITSKQETIAQIKEFEAALQRMNAGNIELLSNRISNVQLAVQTIMNGGTSEIIQMFIKSENEGLRRRLYNIESDQKIGKITAEQFSSQRLDILKLLEKLKEPLSPQEVEFLRQNDKNLSNYLSASNEVDTKVIGEAQRDIKATQTNK